MIQRDHYRHTAHQAGRIVSSLVIGMIIVVGVWQLLYVVSSLPHLVFKSPIDIWRYMLDGRNAASNRRSVFSPLGVTVRDAVIGWLIGTALAVVVGCLFSLSRLVEAVVLPVAFLVQSVPILAMAPLVTVEFGRGVLSVVVITTVITFLPGLLQITLGLRSSPEALSDVVGVYGGGRLFYLRSVAVPSAVPSIFAAARLAAPTSLVAALLAEYFSTGTGIGSLLATSQTTFDYSQIWAAVVLVCLSGLFIYALVSLLELPILARFDAEAFEV